MAALGGGGSLLEVALVTGAVGLNAFVWVAFGSYLSERAPVVDALRGE